MSCCSIRKKNLIQRIEDGLHFNENLLTCIVSKALGPKPERGYDKHESGLKLQPRAVRKSR